MWPENINQVHHRRQQIGLSSLWNNFIKIVITYWCGHYDKHFTINWISLHYYSVPTLLIRWRWLWSGSGIQFIGYIFKGVLSTFIAFFTRTFFPWNCPAFVEKLSCVLYTSKFSSQRCNPQPQFSWLSLLGRLRWRI
jgi:hypothetical protein